MKEYTKSILQILAGVVGLASLFMFLDNYLSDKIDQRITDPDYIAKLSRSLRPFAIFDQNEITIYDHGAMSLIDSITVKAIDQSHLTEIRIYFNFYVQLPPLIESLGPHIYEFLPKRGKENLWVYELTPPAFHSGSKTPERFRIEILK